MFRMSCGTPTDKIHINRNKKESNLDYCGEDWGKQTTYTDSCSIEWRMMTWLEPCMRARRARTHTRAYIRVHAESRQTHASSCTRVQIQKVSQLNRIKSNKTKTYIFRSQKGQGCRHHRSVLFLIRIWSVWENTNRFDGIGRDRFL